MQARCFGPYYTNIKSPEGRMTATGTKETDLRRTNVGWLPVVTLLVLSFRAGGHSEQMSGYTQLSRSVYGWL